MTSTADLDQKGTAQKARNPGRWKNLPIKFDHEGFFLTWGIGVACAGIGALIIWATKTAPAGASASTGFTTAQRLARQLPRSTQETLAFILGILFILFGILCLLLGIKIVLQYITGKLRGK